MLSLTVTIIILFITVLYYYLKSVYFTLRGPIPGIPPQFLFGNLLQTRLVAWKSTSMPDVIIELKEKFGDVYQFWIGTMRFIMISSLDDAQHIFSHRDIYGQGNLFTEKLKLLIPNRITSLTGAQYKRHASVTSPLFRRAKILIHLNTIIDCTDKLLSRWRMNYNDSTKIHLNMIEQSQQLLITVFGCIAFDYDVYAHDNNCGNSKHEFTQALQTLFNQEMILIQLPTFLGRLFLFLNIEVRRARTIINRYLEQIIQHELNKSSEIRAQRKNISFIASLVTSLQENEKLEASKLEEDKKGLSRVEVMHEMLEFLAGGYRASSTVLAWFIYFMSKHPQIQTKIKEELSEYDGRPFSVEQLDSLVYLDCVIQEILRLVPPDLSTVRTLIADDQLPASGFPLKKGDSVMISFYTLTRDKRYWSDLYDLNDFHPERFLDDPQQKNNLSALLIFGGGERKCKGQDLARFQLKIICARLMQFVTFGDGGSEVNAGGYDVTDTNKPKNLGVTITLI